MGKVERAELTYDVIKKSCSTFLIKFWLYLGYLIPFLTWVCFQILMAPWDSSKSWQYYRLIHWIKTVCQMLYFFPSPRGLTFWYNSHFIKAQYQRLKNKSYMSIEHSQILACFLHHFITFFFRKVRSWSVRTGPENFGGPVRSWRTSIC